MSKPAYQAINTSGGGAFVLARIPGQPWRCVGSFTGPAAWDRAVQLERTLQAKAAESGQAVRDVA